MRTILDQYVNVEVERLTNNIVNKAISKRMVQKKYKDLVLSKTYPSQLFSYDTTIINQMKNDMNEYIQDVLLHLDDGMVEDYFISSRIKSGRFKKTKGRGILCDISIGSLRNSVLFANVGPTIPIKLIFTGQVNSDIDIQVKEYGINNVMIELYLIMKVKEQVSMPLTSEQKEITIRTPISFDIVKGELPKYYGGYLK